MDASVIPEDVRPDPSRYDARILVDGEILPCTDRCDPVLSVIMVEGARVPLGRMPRVDAATALRALQAAERAWDHGAGEWPASTLDDRCRTLERFIDAVRPHREELARLLMWEIGKTRKDAESEVDRTLAYLEDTVAAARAMDDAGDEPVRTDGFTARIRRVALGVTLCMGPFNYPLNETWTTLIPALLMGNTAVVKLPKHGGLPHLLLLEAFQVFPRGVVNVIQGDGPEIIGPILASGTLNALGFIGTSRVANLLRKQHPKPNRLRCILGLEAKNPAIVCASADLDRAVPECLSGALSFNGQRCTALKLLFVHRSVADTFVARLVEALAGWKAGLPWEPGVKLTPLPEDGKPAWLGALVADAVEKGARIVNPGGGTVEGTFYRPAVVHPVTPDMRLFHEEQFGPVVPVAVWEHEDELEAFARTSPYGQQVSIFSQDPAEMARMVDRFVPQVARVNVNNQCRRGPDTLPFTGRKDSAEGTLSVTDALRSFSIRAMVAWPDTESGFAAQIGGTFLGR